MKHRTIPIFIPEMACPFRCIYCNQHLISGQQRMPSDEEIRHTIEAHLATIEAGAHVEIGFFGGTFTGLPLCEQERLLRLVQPYGLPVRLSTRPDYISEPVVELLSRYGVRTVELGVQSLDAEVLQMVHRGYGPEAVEKAAQLIQAHGMEVGMQMMVGLPGDTPHKALHTAQRIVALGATNTRIYPTLVVKDTALATMYERGHYRPLTLEEAVQWCAPLLRLFEERGLAVLRVGLHPTEGFISHRDYLAGPFHVSFKELVMTEIFFREFSRLPLDGAPIECILVNPSKLNAAIGHKARNLIYLRQYFPQLRIQSDASLKGYDFTIVNC